LCFSSGRYVQSGGPEAGVHAADTQAAHRG